jgi:hypothetical protein
MNTQSIALYRDKVKARILFWIVFCTFFPVNFYVTQTQSDHGKSLGRCSSCFAQILSYQVMPAMPLRSYIGWLLELLLLTVLLAKTYWSVCGLQEKCLMKFVGKFICSCKHTWLSVQFLHFFVGKFL